MLVDKDYCIACRYIKFQRLFYPEACLSFVLLTHLPCAAAKMEPPTVTEESPGLVKESLLAVREILVRDAPNDKVAPRNHAIIH